MPAAQPRYVIYGALDVTHTVWRVLTSTPATADDFRSYNDLERTAPYAMYLRLMGVSTFSSATKAANAARQLHLGNRLAEVDIRKDRKIAWCLTNPQTGHIELWAPADALMECVIGYADVGDY